MIKKLVKINLSTGLEARPVAQLVQLASQYECEIHMEAGEKKVNAKSIMGMMTLGLALGQSLDVEIEGEDEKDAMYSIEQYLLGK